MVLAPALWSRLSSEEQAELLARHRQRYYVLSAHLYQEDRKNPYYARAIALRELPDLLFAVHGALDAGEEWAVNFVDKVNSFLDYFGLNRDRAELTRRVEQAVGEVGSQTWFLARDNVGDQLFSAGRYQEAAQVFGEILAGLGEEPSYKRCVTLGRLGRCFADQGQAAQAAALYRQGLAVAEQLEASDSVKRQMGAMQSDLGDVLRDMGDYGEARIAYEKSLAIGKETGDFRSQAVTQGQLGTLELLQGNLSEAEQLSREAIATFQQLNEPSHQAIYLHRLGMVYQEAQQWDAAEQAYRQAARIRESQGNLAGAAGIWNQLALINGDAGRPEAAEAWYHKAIEGFKDSGDHINESKALGNLANLLRNQPNRLEGARQLAEEVLAIHKTLDPAAAEIWKTYGILADIAEKQGDTTQAREYLRLSREARAAFAGTQYELREFGGLIAAVVTVATSPPNPFTFLRRRRERKQLEAALEEWVKAGWGNLVAAIHRILKGERDKDVLCEGLYLEDSMIIYAILRGIADPETLKPLLEG